MFLAELPDLFDVISSTTYLALAAAALWGLYCIVIVWTRVNQKRFKSEEAQDVFMDDVDQMLSQGDFEGAAEYCDGDSRALPQIIEMAVNHRDLGYKKSRQFVLDRFQRDVMSDLEYRLSWVGTVIKAAPMIGLFGTVFGMMGAFKTLATADSVEPSALADDINIALRTTACGLAIAIPLMILVANVNIRIAKMEDLVGSGLARFMVSFKSALAKYPASAQSPSSAAMEPVAVQSPPR
jgi:biopolymer transport protein ExbB/TolQ